MKDINDNSGSKKIIYLIGNKIDLINEKQVDFNEALELATKNGMRAMEISCKYDLNVHEVLMKISLEIYGSNFDKKNFHQTNNSFILKQSKKDRSTCCLNKKV